MLEQLEISQEQKQLDFFSEKNKKELETILYQFDCESKGQTQKPGYIGLGYFPTTKIREHISNSQLSVPQKLLNMLSDNPMFYYKGETVKLTDKQKMIVIYTLSYIVYLTKSQIKRIENDDIDSVPKISDEMKYYTHIFKERNKSYEYNTLPMILITRKRLSLMFGTKQSSIALSYLMDKGIIQRLDVKNEHDYRVYVNENTNKPKGTILEDLEYLQSSMINIILDSDNYSFPIIRTKEDINAERDFKLELSKKQIEELDNKERVSKSNLYLNDKQTKDFLRFKKVIHYDVPVLEHENEELKFLIEGLFRARLPHKYINIFLSNEEQFILDYCQEDIAKHCKTKIDFNKPICKTDLINSKFSEQDYIKFIQSETKAIHRFIEWQNAPKWKKYSNLSTCVGDRVFGPVNLIPSGLRKYLVFRVGLNKEEQALESRDVSTSIPRVVSMLTIDFLKDKIKKDTSRHYPSTIEKAIESDLLLNCIENNKNIYEEFSNKTGMTVLEAKINFLSMLNGKKSMQKHMEHLPMTKKFICSLKRDESYMMDNYNKWCDYYNPKVKGKKLPSERLKYIHYTKLTEYIKHPDSTEEKFVNRNVFTQVKLKDGRFQSESNKHRKGGYHAKLLRSGNLLYEYAYQIESDIMRQAIAILNHEYNIVATSIHDELLFLEGYGDIVEKVLFKVSEEAYKDLKMKVK